MQIWRITVRHEPILLLDPEMDSAAALAAHLPVQQEGALSWHEGLQFLP